MKRDFLFGGSRTKTELTVNIRLNILFLSSYLNPLFVYHSSLLPGFNQNITASALGTGGFVLHSGAQTDGVKDQRAESYSQLWAKSLLVVGSAEGRWVLLSVQSALFLL